MKKSIPLFILLFLLVSFSAASQDAQQLESTAKSFTLQGDFSNAILVLNRAIQMNPANADMKKDLAFNYYMQKDYDRALATIKPVIEGGDADDQAFQIAGFVYQALNLRKDCERLYKKGIERFPESGAMYNEYGQFLWTQGDQTAIKQW